MTFPNVLRTIFVLHGIAVVRLDGVKSILLDKSSVQNTFTMNFMRSSKQMSCSTEFSEHTLLYLSSWGLSSIGSSHCIHHNC